MRDVAVALGVAITDVGWRHLFGLGIFYEIVLHWYIWLTGDQIRVVGRENARHCWVRENGAEMW